MEGERGDEGWEAARGDSGELLTLSLSNYPLDNAKLSLGGTIPYGCKVMGSNEMTLNFF